MKHFGAYEAKKNFSKLLSDVIKGEKFVITKHSLPVAMIIPFLQDNTELIKDAIRTLQNLKKRITLGKELSIRKMREQG